MTNNNGLSNEEVIVNRKKYGSNTFSKKKQDSFFKLLKIRSYVVSLLNI